VVQYGDRLHLGAMYRVGNFFFWIDLNVRSVKLRSTQGKQWKLSIIPTQKRTANKGSHAGPYSKVQSSNPWHGTVYRKDVCNI